MKAVLVKLVFLALSFALATSYQTLSLEEILSKAEIAFYGTVIDVQTVDKDNEPWTVVSFEVLESFIGLDAEAASYELSFYGGNSDTGDTLQVSLMPQFNPGDNLLILAYDAPYYSPIVGFRQGLWRETPTGFRSEKGSLLSLDESNNLVLEGSGASIQDILERLPAAFEGAQ